MQRDEKIRAFGVGDGRAIFQGYESVIPSGQNHLHSHFLFEFPLEFFCYRQNNVFFCDASHANGPGVLAAVSRVQNNLADSRNRRLLAFCRQCRCSLFALVDRGDSFGIFLSLDINHEAIGISQQDGVVLP